jgi:perosamine synthetase
VKDFQEGASVIVEHKKQIPWWRPEIGTVELDLIQEVLKNNYLNEGEVTTRFEEEIAKRVGARYAIGVTSGTTALYLSLMALGIGPGDEVVVPDITFIATANAVTMTGAKVVLADVDQATFTLDPGSFEKALTPRTKAVIPVHVSGRGGTIFEILDMAARRGIPVVEDAAEALLSRCQDRALGTIGITGCFSFSPNKTITTGQGGIITTSDPAVLLRLRELKDQGRPARGTGGDDIHASIGFNFKLTNLQAAVGLGQLTYLNARVARQKRIYEIYREELRELEEIRLFPFDTARGEIPQWTDVLAEKRDQLDAYLNDHGAHCRRYWFPLHTQKPYREPETRFPNSTRLAPMALWLPSAFQMTDQDTLSVCKLIKQFYR